MVISHIKKPSLRFEHQTLSACGTIWMLEEIPHLGIFWSRPQKPGRTASPTQQPQKPSEMQRRHCRSHHCPHLSACLKVIYHMSADWE